MEFSLPASNKQSNPTMSDIIDRTMPPSRLVTDPDELEFLAILRAMPPHRYEAAVRMAKRVNAGMPYADAMVVMQHELETVQ